MSNADFIVSGITNRSSDGAENSSQNQNSPDSTNTVPPIPLELPISVFSHCGMSSFEPPVLVEPPGVFEQPGLQRKTDIEHFQLRASNVADLIEGLYLSNISQFHIHVGSICEKLEFMRNLYSFFSSNQSIIFVNSISNSENVRTLLVQSGHNVSSFHSQLPPYIRDLDLSRFLKGEHNVLIATDVLPRGLDISNIDVIINFDVPYDKIQFIHRIGRIGGFGIKGVVINLVSSEDEIKFQKICSDLLPHCNGQDPFHLKSQSEEDIQSIIDEIENKASEHGLIFLGQRLIEPLVRFVQEELQLMEPSEVQAKAIPRLLAGQNLIVQAHTGSGKSPSFLLPMFQSIDPSLKDPQALIIAPTRELALLTHQKWVRPFVELTLDPDNPDGELTSITAVVRPELILNQKVIIDHIIVGTPGTIKSWIQRGNVLPETIE